MLVYRYDPAKGTLTPNDPPAVSVEPKLRPAHFAFHPDGKHAYVINEMANTVTAFDYDAEKGVLKPVQTIDTLPKDFKGQSWTAEVVVHPTGKFVYGSNRGHNSIAVFTVDPKTGTLTAAGHQAKDIKTPRNFIVDPTGKYLLVANQDGDSVIVFQINPETGGADADRIEGGGRETGLLCGPCPRGNEYRRLRFRVTREMSLIFPSSRETASVIDYFTTKGTRTVSVTVSRSMGRSTSTSKGRCDAVPGPVFKCGVGDQRIIASLPARFGREGPHLSPSADLHRPCQSFPVSVVSRSASGATARDRAVWGTAPSAASLAPRPAASASSPSDRAALLPAGQP